MRRFASEFLQRTQEIAVTPNLLSTIYQKRQKRPLNQLKIGAHFTPRNMRYSNTHITPKRLQLTFTSCIFIVLLPSWAVRGYVPNIITAVIYWGIYGTLIRAINSKPVGLEDKEKGNQEENSSSVHSSDVRLWKRSEDTMIGCNFILISVNFVIMPESVRWYWIPFFRVHVSRWKQRIWREVYKESKKAVRSVPMKCFVVTNRIVLVRNSCQLV